MRINSKQQLRVWPRHYTLRTLCLRKATLILVLCTPAFQSLNTIADTAENKNTIHRTQS